MFAPGSAPAGGINIVDDTGGYFGRSQQGERPGTVHHRDHRDRPGLPGSARLEALRLDVLDGSNSRDNGRASADPLAGYRGDTSRAPHAAAPTFRRSDVQTFRRSNVPRGA